MTPGGARAKTNKRKVLVVEDEKDIRDLIRYNLEQDGFAVLDTDEGELALALVKRERPALVILDIMLPGMSGLEICRAIRQDDERGAVGLREGERALPRVGLADGVPFLFEVEPDEFADVLLVLDDEDGALRDHGVPRSTYPRCVTPG